MKKILLLLLLFIVVGCSSTKTMECTLTNDEGTIKTNISYKDGIILAAKATLTFNDQNKAKEYCDIYTKYSENNTVCKEDKIVFNNVNKTADLETTDNIDSYKNYLENLGYSCLTK